MPIARVALALVVLLAFGAVAVSNGTAPVTRVVLGSGDAPETGDDELALSRVTVPPGTALAPHTHPGLQIATVRSGRLTYTVVRGTARVRRASGSWDAGPGNVIASQPGRPVRTWMSDHSRLLVIRLPDSATDRIGTANPDRMAAGRDWRPARSLAPQRLASVGRLARLVFDAQDGTDAVSADEGLAFELQRVLLALLSEPPVQHPGQSLGQSGEARGVGDPDRSPVAGPLPGSVRRAQALMIAAPDGGLPLGLLAAQCGVGVRTLQENFRAFTGQTPTEWWRGYRLDRVHDRLSAGRPGTTLTDSATAFGFHHLGRFAEQYRLRFGLPPSETLRRAADNG